MSGKRFAASGARNICIVGHVDHGKSSYADSLLAANGIISARSAGKMRYLDSREDEQERGITMESSAVSLSYRAIRKTAEGTTPVDYLINLIDTPGHVDFSSEVSTASRLCDGALVMVDAVEGVCTQTITVLRQVWMERLRPILVVNKVDRIITELKLAPIEAHHHLTQLIEQVNAVMGSFHAGERMGDDLRWREEREKRLAKKKEKLQDQAAGLANEGAPQASTSNGTTHDDEEDNDTYEERDDEDIYFAPEQGNVIFASAIDGWAFRVGQFAQIHATRLGIKETNLRKVLWGDFYLDPKTKRVFNRKHLGKRSLKPMFVQFVLENLWAVYDSVLVNHDAERLNKIVTALGVKVRPQEMKSKDYRSLLTTILSQWLPLASATFRAVVEIVPAPQEAQAVRIPKMLHPDLPYHQLTVKPENKLEEDLYSGNSAGDAFVVAYVSKMFAVQANALPQNQRKPMTAEEMRQRGRASREAAAALAATGAVVTEEAKALSASEGDTAITADAPVATPKEEEAIDEAEECLLGFTRLYSGVIRAGQTLYAILPKYNASLPPMHQRNKKFIVPVKIEYLYMMMGRELVMVNEVPAGNVFAISGLEGKVLRNGTLCGFGDRTFDFEAPTFERDREALVNLAGLNLASAPIVRVALEPKEPSQMPQLVEGLRLLNQADSCVETLVQETGEHVILTAGELHLERCLRDLRERFAKVEIQASPPIVPFRETAVQGIDMAAPKIKDAPRGTIRASVQGDLLEYQIRARPLPKEITAFLTAHIETLKRVVQRERELSNKAESANYEDSTQDTAAEGQGDHAGGLIMLNAAQFWKELEVLFAKAGKDWQGVSSRIWAFGPRRIGPNILVDSLGDSERSLQHRSQVLASKSSVTGTPARAGSPDASIASADRPLPTDSAFGDSALGENSPSKPGAFDESLETAFQLTTLRGPLCHEPVTGMAYFVEKLRINTESENADALQTRLSQVTGSLITSANDAFKQGLLDWSPRLLLAMYSCDIQASTDVLGKVYGVVARRRGRIVAEEMKEGTSFFTVSALLPVVEGFGFADEIRKRTSGAASPQLVFHGFEMLDQDPFWVPTTEEELEDLGEKADRENIARRYMDGVRKRKGLFVEKMVVEHAEKQRTLKK